MSARSHLCLSISRFSQAIDNANRTQMLLGHYPVLSTPSHSIERCSESIITWMLANATIPLEFLNGDTPNQRHAHVRRYFICTLFQRHRDLATHIMARIHNSFLRMLKLTNSFYVALPCTSAQHLVTKVLFMPTRPGSHGVFAVLSPLLDENSSATMKLRLPLTASTV
jgi:hypothetical protein